MITHIVPLLSKINVSFLHVIKGEQPLFIPQLPLKHMLPAVNELEQSCLTLETTGRYPWGTLQLPHSAVCRRSWHTSASGHQPKPCSGAAAACSPAHSPATGPSWHAPSVPYPVAGGSETLCPQNLAYISPIK